MQRSGAPFHHRFMILPLSCCTLPPCQLLTIKSSEVPHHTLGPLLPTRVIRQMKSVHDIIQVQQQLEALELAHQGGKLGDEPSVTELSDSSSGSSSGWRIPCVSVDEEGNSFFSEKSIPLFGAKVTGIGALSDLIPASGEVAHVIASLIALPSWKLQRSTRKRPISCRTADRTCSMEHRTLFCVA